PLVRVFTGDKENPRVDLGDDEITSDRQHSREVKVFSTELPAFDLRAACTQPGFKVETTPIPAGATVDGYTVLSGYTVEVRSTDDLPLGYVRADLNLTLSKLDKEPDRTLTLPVSAVVGNGKLSVKPRTIHFRKPKITEEETVSAVLQFTFPSDKEDVK